MQVCYIDFSGSRGSQEQLAQRLGGKLLLKVRPAAPEAEDVEALADSDEAPSEDNSETF